MAAVLLVGDAAAQDTLVIRADNAPLWGSSPKLVEELRIGALEGDPHYSFGDITGVVIDDTGNVWVADDQAATIRRFSRTGEYLGDVGRRGEGPGEFESIAGLQRLRDGRVAVFDVRGRRISLFTESGKFLSSVASVGCSVFTERRFASFVVAANDDFFVQTCAIPKVHGSPPSTIWVHLSSSGATLDTVRVPSEANLETLRSSPLGSMTLYAPHVISAMSPLGYLVTGRSDRYALQRPLRDGRVVRIERTWTPVPVSRGERAMAEARQDDGRRVRAAAHNPPVPSIRVPDTKPAYWALQVDHDGRIWVALHQEGFFRAETERARAARMARRLGGPGPAMEWWEPLVVDVIEPSGRFLGTIRFPNPRTGIAWATGDSVWAVELGEFDESYLVRYRIDHT